MRLYFNPFEYEAAHKLSADKLIAFFIEDFTQARFLESKRNVYFVGERGTGKTMALRYHSLPVRAEIDKRAGRAPDYGFVGVHIPCKTPLIHRGEHELLDEFQASVISEHYLVVTIMDAVVETLEDMPDLLEDAQEEQIRAELSFTLGLEVPQVSSLLADVRLALQHENKAAQTQMNAKETDRAYQNALAFNTGVVPLLTCLKKIPKLHDTHFSFMFDDAQDLNPFQIRALNSWISYRDTSHFSFKVASTKVDRPSFKTASGGSILMGHDFTLIDMEWPYQGKYSDFGKLARSIVKKRLQKIGVGKAPDDYFPMNPDLEADLKKCEADVRKEAEAKYPGGTAKQINDHVYKYARAEYFRRRAASTANLPPYSGFEILVHLSTGVIRNLLDPCFYMYDKMVSQLHYEGKDIEQPVDMIPPQIQSAVIAERSRKKWEWVENDLGNTIEGCSTEQAKRVFQLFDNLAVFFVERLKKHKSEPRAIAFSVSQRDNPHYGELMEILRIARKAQILYEYGGSAKDDSKREAYYVPNRILWPVRGLDPYGQHARVSITAQHLWDAAVSNKRIPFVLKESTDEPDLFDANS